MKQNKHNRYSRRGSPQRPQKSNQSDTSWDAVAEWYSGWMGQHGGLYHRKIALPTLLDLLSLAPGETVLDIGCGHGVPAQQIAELGVRYVGIDASRKLIDKALKQQRDFGRFLVGDARTLTKHLPNQQFDAAFFLLSIQDMDPLEQVLNSAESILTPTGRLVIVMTHPCFRIPRQSGWGYDQQRKLSYRRVDSYLSAKAIPLSSKGRSRKAASQPVTRSFHRPLHTYINALATRGLLVDRFVEVSSSQVDLKSADSQHNNSDIPHFLGIRARKLAPPK